jgi:CRP-like cAMP-binding protein
MEFRNLVLSGLTPAHLAGLLPHLTECHLVSGQVLFDAGDIVSTVYFPSTAVASVTTLMQDGRSVESVTIGYESVVGAVPALSGKPAHSKVFAQVPGDAMRLPSAIFRDKVFHSPELLRTILGYVQGDISQAEQSVACNALHTVDQRLAKWLLLTQDRTGGSVISLTQEYLSIMLGVQRTTVTSAAVSMKRAGLIHYSRGQIDIRDREGLQRAACECQFVGNQPDHSDKLSGPTLRLVD